MRSSNKIHRLHALSLTSDEFKNHLLLIIHQVWKYGLPLVEVLQSKKGRWIGAGYNKWYLKRYIQANYVCDLINIPNDVPVNNGSFIAIYGYQKRNHQELTIHVNDRLDVLEDKQYQGWWLVRLVENGQQGYAPSNYLAKIGRYIFYYIL